MKTYNKIDTAQTVLTTKLNSLTAKYSNQEVTQALERLLRLKKRQAEFDLDKLRNFSIQFSQPNALGLRRHSVSGTLRHDSSSWIRR